MKKNISKKALLIVVAFCMLVVSIVPALANESSSPLRTLQDFLIESYNHSDEYEIVKLTDASNWSGNITSMETVENTTTFTGTNGSAVYKDLIVENEIVQFQGNFHIEADGWVGIKFRSNEPSGAVWDNNRCYAFVMKSQEVEVYKVIDKNLGLIGKASYVFGDDKFHEYQMGVYDTEDGVNLVLNVDGTKVVELSDNNNPIIGKSAMSINIYRDTTSAQISVYSDGTSAFGGIVDRTLKAPKKTLESDHYWSIVTSGENEYMGEIPTLTEYLDEIELADAGGAVYKNAIEGNVYSFSVSSFLDARGDGSGSTLVLFRKQNRDTLYGDNSYGLKITQDGRVGLVKFSFSGAKLFGSIQTGLDFSKRQNLSVEIVEKGDYKAEIYVYVNSTTSAIKYIDNAYSPHFEGPGFVGLVNLGEDVISTLGKFRYETAEHEYEADSTEVLPVYLADYMAEENRQYLHWVYRSDFYNYAGVVITNPKNKVIGTVDFPTDTFELKKYKWSKIYITAVSGDGYKSEPVEIDLNDKRSQYYAKKQEKVVIENGKFIYQNSKKEFVVNGVNYVGLRYGDHSTFEPEFGLTDEYYDYRKAETLLKTLSKYGYNTVRVFVIPGGREEGNAGLGGIYEETEGIYVPYMENFVDFLKRAKKYGIYVFPCMGENEMVHNAFYKELSAGANKQSILFTEEGIKAKQQMLTSFLSYIKNRDASLLNTLLGVSMQNEFTFDGNAAPFNVTKGEYTFLDGISYDMSNADSRRLLANAAVRNYYAKMKEAIQAVDPDMLLSEGTFTLLAVFKDYEKDKGIWPTAGDSRYPMTAVELLETDIDFLDIHVYRYGQEGTAKQVFKRNYNSMLLNTAKAQKLMKKKPVILGEYGGFSTDEEEETLELGMEFAKGLRDLAMKKGFKGAIFWTVDTFEQTGIWHLMDDGGKYLEEMSLLEKKGAK